MNSIQDFVRNNGVLLVALLAVLEGLLCATLLRRQAKLRARLRIAVAAAEDAARTAALAAPGGIDPEVVIHLLRNGRQTTLETVYQLMEQQAAAEEAARRTESARASAEAAPVDPADMSQRLGRYS